MPRERINPAVDPYEVKIGWSADQDVQVGIEVSDGTTLLRMLHWSQAEYLGEQIKKMQALNWASDEEFGRSVLETLDAHDEFRGVWSTLDREGCNRLIKVLRRARDSAFGRDE